MMISPNCPEHARLVLDLALGRLDDGAALEAEAVRETCPVCRAWWRAQFEGEATALVDEAVASVFDDLDLPGRRRGHGLLALAAAAVMACGATALWLAQSPATQGSDTAKPVVVEHVAMIRNMDFETPSAILAQTSRSSADAVREVFATETALVQVDDGRLDSDEIVAADVDSGDALIAAESEPLFVGRFESGDLGDWVPST